MKSPGDASQVQVTSAVSPKVPSFSPPPVAAGEPPLIQPLTSNSNSNQTIVMPSGDIGQDVRDRDIAHIVIGGLSGRG